MRMADQTKLLPCPFCGSDAKIDGLGYAGPADCYEVLVRCAGCDAASASFVVDASEGDDESYAAGLAAAAWNCRADLPAGYRWVKEIDHV
jgi:hypothetical protein